MELNLKVIQVLPLQSGVGKNSGKQWSSQMFIGETMDQYPKKVACSIFNPGQNVATPNVGDMVTASFDLDSRSFTGKDGVERWSTDIRIWKLAPYDPTANVPGFATQQTAPQAQPQQQYVSPQQQWAGAPQPSGYPAQQYPPQQPAPQFAAPQQPQYPQQPAPSNDLPF